MNTELSLLILTNRSQGFKNTSFMFAEQDNKRYWHVDNFHVGEASHLEVFDRNGNHLGEATLNGDLDIEKADSDKKLRM